MAAGYNTQIYNTFLFFFFVSSGLALLYFSGENHCMMWMQIQTLLPGNVIHSARNT